MQHRHVCAIEGRCALTRDTVGSHTERQRADGDPDGMTPPRPTPGGAPGSTTMTPQEREQHRQDMQRAKTGDECQAAAKKQRQEAVQRAKERGEPPPVERVDPCVGR
jgi:hypothetical protein